MTDTLNVLLRGRGYIFGYSWGVYVTIYVSSIYINDLVINTYSLVNVTRCSHLCGFQTCNSILGIHIGLWVDYLPCAHSLRDSQAHSSWCSWHKLCLGLDPWYLQDTSTCLRRTQCTCIGLFALLYYPPIYIKIWCIYLQIVATLGLYRPARTSGTLGRDHDMLQISLWRL